MTRSRGSTDPAMPRAATNLETIRRKVGEKRWVWVERPTLLHDRATGPGQCPCGCESRSGENPEDWAAVLEETIPGPEVLINRLTGQRIVRSEQSEIDGTLAKFDALKLRADLVEHVYMPRRCYRQQLVGIEAAPKVKGFFGGVRAGKTQSLTEECGDQWLEIGGQNVTFYWVAPVLRDCMRAVRKLVTGEAIKGGKHAEKRPPVLHPALVASYPKTEEQIKRGTPIELIDGTRIELRYAGRGESADGGNLKGDAAAWIGVDEGAEITSSQAWHVLIQRTTDSGGRLTTATTPKLGSPLKHLVYDEGADLAANDGSYPLTGYVHLSMLDNPWITPRQAQRTIDTLLKEPNGADLVKQDVYGQWLTPGQRMWEHWDEDVHVVTHHSRKIEDYEIDGRKLRNITRFVAGRFFDRTSADLWRVAGQDFNDRGHFTVVGQVGCPEGLDESDPANWVFYVEDEVRKAGEVYQAAKFLRSQAGAMRALAPDYFAGMAISCDATGAQDRVSEGNVTSTYTLADAYARNGFDIRPCHRSDKSKPINPEKRAQQAILHRLMMRRDLGQDAERYKAGDRTLPPSTRLLINKSRCPELIKGLREQACNEKGQLRKRSDTRDDVISDPVDALLYILWAMFSEAEQYQQRGIRRMIWK